MDEPLLLISDGQLVGITGQGIIFLIVVLLGSAAAVLTAASDDSVLLAMFAAFAVGLVSWCVLELFYAAYLEILGGWGPEMIFVLAGILVTVFSAWAAVQVTRIKNR